MKCDGPPGLGRSCNKRGTEVKMCQGDLMLCMQCEHERFPTASRIFFSSTSKTSTGSKTKSSTVTATSHPVAEQLVVNIPIKISTGKHCKDDCKLKGEDRGEMIQCSMCFRWFHLQCVGLKKSSSDFQYWPCQDCRLTAMRLKNIEKITSDIHKNYCHLNERFDTQSDLLKEVLHANSSLQESLSAQLEKNEQLQSRLEMCTQELRKCEENIQHSPGPRNSTALMMTQTDVLVDKGSSFQGFCTQVTTIEQVHEAIRAVRDLPQCKLATHVMMAYRLAGPVAGPKESCQDDGEQHAGGHLLRVLQQHDLTDTIVFVCRWYGGKHLGPARFTRITEVARNALSQMSGGALDGTTTTPRPPRKVLLIGNSLIRGIDEVTTDDGRDVIVKKQSGATFCDLTCALDCFDDDTITGVHLVAGTREVDGDDPIDIVKEQSKSLITKAKTMFTEVTVSSVIPRIDRDVEERQRLVNEALSEVCSEQEVVFINHDNNFLFRNGDVDSSSFVTDGVHLSRQGTKKLVSNLHLSAVGRANVSGTYTKHQHSNHRHVPHHTHRNNYTDPRGATSNSQARCWFCAEPGHTKEQCGHGRKVQCGSCRNYGHKAKFCSY